MLLSRPTPLCVWPTNGRIIKMAKVLPKEWGVWASHQAPGGEEERKSSFQGQWVSFQETHGTMGNRDSAYKGHPQNLLHSRTQGRSSDWKEPEPDLLADLEKSPGGAGGSWSSLWGHRHQWQLFEGVCSTTRMLLPFWNALDAFGMQAPFWNPLSSSLASGPSSVSATSLWAPLVEYLEPSN